MSHQHHVSPGKIFSTTLAIDIAHFAICQYLATQNSSDIPCFPISRCTRQHGIHWIPDLGQVRRTTYVLVKHHLRASVLDTRVHRGGDLDTDHRLVVTTLRLKFKKNNPRTSKQ